jgi:site-specific DNA recombinase
VACEVKSAGGLSYGYKIVRSMNSKGEPVRGDRAVEPVEAAVVARIFGMFADGHSPIAIAKTLNAEGVRGPNGKAWRDTTIRGHALRGTGILRNELYIGRLVWNRMHFRKDPESGKRVSLMNPADRWIVEDVPDLRIVDMGLWDRVQARNGAIRVNYGADKPDRPRFWEKRRSKHLLTGKMTCGVCGGAFSAVGKDVLACTAARCQGTCDNRHSIRRPVLDGLILDALQTNLMQPEHLAFFIEEFTREWNCLQAEASAARSGNQRELEGVERQISKLIDALTEGFRGPSRQQKLDNLEARKTDLERKLQSTPAPAPALHPNLAGVYRERVTQLHAALRASPDRAGALEAARSLIERVVLHPSSEGNGLEIELVGEIAAMVALGLGHDSNGAGVAAAADRGLFARSVKVVAGIGFEPMTFRL